MVICDKCNDDVGKYYEDDGLKLCFSCYCKRCRKKYGILVDKTKLTQEFISDVLKKKIQTNFDEMEKFGLVFRCNLNDHLGILKELKKDEILLALTRSSKPSASKVFITNKRILIRKIKHDYGTELGIDFDLSYSDIQKNLITAHRFTKNVHFNSKWGHIEIVNTSPSYIIQDIIKELVEKEEKKK